MRSKCAQSRPEPSVPGLVYPPLTINSHNSRVLLLHSHPACYAAFQKAVGIVGQTWPSSRFNVMTPNAVPVLNARYHLWIRARSATATSKQPTTPRNRSLDRGHLSVSSIDPYTTDLGPFSPPSISYGLPVTNSVPASTAFSCLIITSSKSRASNATLSASRALK